MNCLRVCSVYGGFMNLNLGWFDFEDCFFNYNILLFFEVIIFLVKDFKKLGFKINTFKIDYIVVY